MRSTGFLDFFFDLPFHCRKVFLARFLRPFWIQLADTVERNKMDVSMRYAEPFHRDPDSRSVGCPLKRSGKRLCCLKEFRIAFRREVEHHLGMGFGNY